MKRLIKAVGVVAAVAMTAFAANAQSDATAIATQASSAFGTIAPITISIVAFYVILKIAKRVVK